MLARGRHYLIRQNDVDSLSLFLGVEHAIEQAAIEQTGDSPLDCGCSIVIVGDPGLDSAEASGQQIDLVATAGTNE
jgi:hypothetical protein